MGLKNLNYIWFIYCLGTGSDFFKIKISTKSDHDNNFSSKRLENLKWHWKMLTQVSDMVIGSLLLWLKFNFYFYFVSFFLRWGWVLYCYLYCYHGRDSNPVTPPHTHKHLYTSVYKITNSLKIKKKIKIYKKEVSETCTFFLDKSWKTQSLKFMLNS